MRYLLRNYFMVAVWATTLLAGCFRHGSSSSELATTSDKLQEYGYIIEGTLEIPLREEPYQLAYFWDLHRNVMNHPYDEEAGANLKKALSSPQAFRQLFAEKNGGGFPIVGAGGEIDRSKVQYWVAQQLKYTQNQSKKRGISLTLKSLREMTVKGRTDDLLTVTYKVEALGVVDVSRLLGGERSSTLQRGDRFMVPRNLIEGYYRSMGAGFLSYYQSEIAKLQVGSLREVLASPQPQQLLAQTKDNSMGNRCYQAIGEVASSFSYFYYFSPEDPHCSEQIALSPIQVGEVKVIPVKTTYPEFHRLFEDKKVDLFIFFNGMGGEEKEAAQALAQKLTAKGYHPEPQPEPYHLKYSKLVSGITLNVEWSVGSEGRTLFRNAIKTHEIVIYDGHAGYGANIDDTFANEEAYPAGQYQIFMLNGCSTYKYGMTQLLDTKALKDFDFYHQNIDVVTTYTSVAGHQQNDVLWETMEAVIPYYVTPAIGPEQTKEFADRFSWLAIVTKINQVSDRTGTDNGVFMVSGEEDNDFAPGKSSFPGMKQYRPEDLIALIGDEGQPEKARIMAVQAYDKYYLVQPGDQDLEQPMARAREFCNTYRLGAAPIFAATFYLPGCQVKQLTLQGNMRYHNLALSAQKPVRFFADGTIERAAFAEAQSVGGIKVQPQVATYFYSSGRLKQFRPVENFKDSQGRVYGNWYDIVLYESGTVKFGSLDPQSSVSYQNFKLGGSVSFYENGALRSGCITEGNPVETRGFKFSGLGVVIFYPDGTLNAISTSNMERQDSLLSISGAASVTFYPGGRLKVVAAWGSDDSDPKGFVYQGIKYKLLLLRENGNPALASFASSQRMESRMPCSTVGEDAAVIWDPAGNVVGCKLAEDFQIGERHFSQGEMLLWSMDGRIFTAINETAANSYLASIGVVLGEMFPSMDEADHD